MFYLMVKPKEVLRGKVDGRKRKRILNLGDREIYVIKVCSCSLLTLNLRISDVISPNFAFCICKMWLVTKLLKGLSSLMLF